MTDQGPGEPWRYWGGEAGGEPDEIERIEDLEDLGDDLEDEVVEAQIDPEDQPVFAQARALARPTIEDYCRASAEYVRSASWLGAARGKATQIGLSHLLAQITLLDLRDRLQLPLPQARAAETKIGGGLRDVKADVSEVSALNGVTLAIELKPVHLAVGRAIWNRFGDVRTFAVNIHLKFPYAVVGGVMTLPTHERKASGNDEEWKETSHLINRAVTRFERAGGRKTEGDAAHLLEGIAVVVFSEVDGAIDEEVPPPGSGLRWHEFIDLLSVAYDARFGAT